jgi:outer membrane immunogenic protein
MRNKIALAALAASLSSFATALPAGAQATPAHTLPAAEVSFTYSALRANAPVGNCGCFWMRGGSGELAVPVWRQISVVAEVSGERKNNLPGNPGIGLSLASAMGGVRLGHSFGKRYSPFAQGVVGVVHGFDGYFPGTPGPTGAATSLAMAAGLGLDMKLRQHVALRLIQGEYQYMQLPNNAINPANQQHDIRLSAGIVFRFTR